MHDTTGPVQLLGVGFPAGARFEGRIAEELDRLESSGAIRILDFVFLHKDAATGALVRMDLAGTSAEPRVTTLLEGEPDDPGDGGDEWPHEGRGAFRLTAGDLREVAQALEPDTSAGFIVFEHVWARGLEAGDRRHGRRAVRRGLPHARRGRRDRRLGVAGVRRRRTGARSRAGGRPARAGRRSSTAG